MKPKLRKKIKIIRKLFLDILIANVVLNNQRVKI